MELQGPGILVGYVDDEKLIDREFSNGWVIGISGLGHFTLGMLANTWMFPHTRVGLMTEISHIPSVLAALTPTICKKRSDVAPR